MQKPWFKTFIWFMATVFFYLASAIIISALSPDPSEQQIMQFMSGTMAAMQNSLMGLSMELEKDSSLILLVNSMVFLITPLIISSVIAGVLISMRNRYGK